MSTTASVPPPAAASPPNPPPSRRRRKRSLPSRLRAFVIHLIIASFLLISPLSLLLLFPWTPLFLGLPSSFLARLFFVYATAEATFGVWYIAQAYRLGGRREPTRKGASELRDVVRVVLESGMGHSAAARRQPTTTTASAEPKSPSSSTTSSRRSSFATSSARQRIRQHSLSHDSGYGSDTSSSSSDYKLSPSPSTSPPALSPLLELSDPLSPSSSTSYNFLSPQKLKATDPRAEDFREASRQWFHGLPFSRLTREAVSSWMAWSLYGVGYEELDGVCRPDWDGGEQEEGTRRDEDLGRDELETVDYSVRLWEARAGVSLPSTPSPSSPSPSKVLRLTLDPLRVLPRPLFLYLCIALVQSWYTLRLRNWGFKEEQYGGMRYLVRVPEGWTARDGEKEGGRALLLLHGLGVGAVQYAALINRLATDPAFAQRPIVVLLQPHLSMEVFNSRYLSPPAAEESNASIVEMAKRNGFDERGMTVLSHSNGTIVHGWLVKAHPGLVRRSCLVDPVCFALWEPSLPWNFLYAPTTTTSSLLQRYFVARELGVANLLQRNFDWINSLLVPSLHLPLSASSGGAKVFLSERDAIVDAGRVGRYLVEEGMREGEGMRMWKGRKHGEGLLRGGREFEEVVRWVRDD